MTARTATTYEWVKGHTFVADPNAARAEIEAVAAQHGGICTPANLVERARPEGNPLHADLWNLSDEEAAYAHRCETAGRMIRHLRVRGGSAEPTPAFYNVTNGYVPADNAKRDPDFRAAVLRQAQGTLEATRRRYQHLSELDRVWAVIKDVVG